MDRYGTATNRLCNRTPTEQGCTGSSGGINNGWGLLAVRRGSIMGSGETVCCWRFWCKLGVWDIFRGWYAASGYLVSQFGGAGGGSELVVGSAVACSLVSVRRLHLVTVL